jgi:hypothetical protein
LIAEMADEANRRSPASLAEVAKVVSSMFWERYERAYASEIARAREVDAKGDNRTEEEESERVFWEQNLSGGFCLGGRWSTDRQPTAFEVKFDPFRTEAPETEVLPLGSAKFWGCPNLIDRLIRGMDLEMFMRILSSDHWTGTDDELFALLDQGTLGQPYDLPLREALDWIYASIYTTIKAMKFSHLAPVCGGPIEIAAITSDRPFRWVRHKRLGEAIAAHDTREDWL